jgi:D-arabinose 1-dehydrogenase-like Zn-dependent alcohol dehydrogenase
MQAPRGRFHTVGVLPQIQAHSFHLIAAQREISNEAMAHLEAGKARYRIVLKNDLS